MVAMYNLSHYYNEPGIFKNVLYAFFLTIAEVVVIFGIYLASFFLSIANIPQTAQNPPTAFVQAMLSYVVVIAVLIVLVLVNGFLYMRAFNKLKEKSGVDSFGTAGILYLIGMIIPLIAWIGWIFAAIGFQRLQPTQTSPISYPATATPTLYTSKTLPKLWHGKL